MESLSADPKLVRTSREHRFSSAVVLARCAAKT
jgi:hypothetical protein